MRAGDGLQAHRQRGPRRPGRAELARWVATSALAPAVAAAAEVCVVLLRVFEWRPAGASPLHATVRLRLVNALSPQGR